MALCGSLRGMSSLRPSIINAHRTRLAGCDSKPRMGNRIEEEEGQAMSRRSPGKVSAAGERGKLFSDSSRKNCPCPLYGGRPNILILIRAAFPDASRQAGTIRKKIVK